MGKVITLEKAIKVSNALRKQHKTIVLAGGCFDILHSGHLKYLENAKKAGDVLFILLESDENVSRLKGKERPINSQKKRAEKLSKIPSVDFVILAPQLRGNQDYFETTLNLKPQIIAITEEDKNKKEKEAQAKSIGGRVVTVTKLLKNYSTTKILENTYE